ncbi:enoyl-CoA hydratase/isomerase family protein [Nocardioides stalactiti]|uniref:enoyl-CoA hydratase/isomerase family protein n=1 Tax=Nocardioides stalactiti TaxID=2755356 RepID=UPI0015FFD381|nr:enoyl-CoA hydratase/isomerase family protein [Nocardioides stalactiti]
MSEIRDLTHLRLERPAAGVAMLVLDLPELRNAMSDEMTASWVRAVDHLAADPSVRAVVVTGEGSAFCSGGNLSWLASEPDAGVDDLRSRMLPFYRSWLAIRRLEVPTIAAINGAAIGAGLAMALACDLRVAARGAKMGVPFTRLGIHPGMATTYLLPDVVGPSAARDLLLTGRIVEAEEALGLGLVSRVLEQEDFRAQAVAAAVDIAAAAPIATRLTKIALSRPHASLESCLEWEALAQPITLATADLLEGISAAQERRAAVFEGR